MKKKNGVLRHSEAGKEGGKKKNPMHAKRKNTKKGKAGEHSSGRRRHGRQNRRGKQLSKTSRKNDKGRGKLS